MDCLFCKMIAGEIPVKKVYEDEKTFAFHDINPQAPTHVLIVPKKHIAGLKEAKPEDAEMIGYCQLVAAKIARERNIENGYRKRGSQSFICIFIYSADASSLGHRDDGSAFIW